jgi:hypothetical protein
MLMMSVSFYVVFLHDTRFCFHTPFKMAKLISKPALCKIQSSLMSETFDL